MYDYREDRDYKKDKIKENRTKEGNNLLKTQKQKRHKKQLKLAAVAAAFGLIASVGTIGVQYGKAITENSVTAGTEIERTIPVVNSLASIPSTGSADSSVIDVSDIVKETLPSVVAVNCITYNQINTGINIFGMNPYGEQNITEEVDSCGTGIIIGENNENLLILTNNHVIEDASKVSVVFVDNEEVEGSVLGADADADIAVILIPLSEISEGTKNQIKTAVFGDSSGTAVGEAAIAIGNALGYGQSVTTGVISALNRDVDLVDKTMTLIQTDAAINGGNSGGPLLNAKGEVIGINTVKYSKAGVEGMGYAIPINTAKPIIESIINGEQKQKEETGSVYLGIYGIDLDEQYQRMYGMPAGILVYKTVENSPAEQYGLQGGSIITGIDGKDITTMEELSQILQEHKPGDTIQISIVQLGRNNQYISSVISVVLGSIEE